jgi:LysM repeat protein
VSRRSLARVGAPVAFLAAVTAGALLVRAGLHGAPPASTSGTTVEAAATVQNQHAKHVLYKVERGETFASIAQKLGTTVARLEQLNPHIDPSSLTIGEKIRVK